MEESSIANLTLSTGHSLLDILDMVNPDHILQSNNLSTVDHLCPPDSRPEAGHLATLAMVTLAHNMELVLASLNHLAMEGRTPSMFQLPFINCNSNTTSHGSHWLDPCTDL